MGKCRKMLLILLSLFFVFNSSTAYAKQYQDTRNHWANEYIDKLSDDGFVSGYESDTFRPDSEISRVEFYKIVNSMANLKKTYTVTFADVSTSDWFYKDVSKAIKAGYLTPTTGNLNPNNPISRQEVMGILGYMYKLKPNTSVLKQFSDASKISEDNKGYVGALVNAGIVSGDSGQLRPNDGISRAEACKIIYLLIYGNGNVNGYGLPAERVVVDSKIKFGDQNLYN
ncbi:S-layer homology domain-containing protein [Anaerosphaera multitolerans]|uniref:S-layer homology domain-containing protein n=1 Tax=Anaerosphaera multitolerans TaxID=2487351 RepID=A0A437S8B5_9FIRM|nr:S-layer homology domain-containing protein [Anaerosphaera multitolerans]RVU55067.1 S-layer homology domain-containing protein [Anaerosphaera multitolerans]